MIPTKEEWNNVLCSRHGSDIQNKFSNICVAVCGLGGLGSNIAICLARIGIGKLILVDFDRVDISNLHRQQYKACQIGQLKTEAMKDILEENSPYGIYETHNAKIDETNAEEILKEADIICEALDSAEEKAKLANFVLEYMPDKYIIAASGMAGYEDANTIKTKRITDKFYLCGDEISDITDGTGLIASRVMLCAAHQAHTVVRIIANKTEIQQKEVN